MDDMPKEGESPKKDEGTQKGDEPTREGEPTKDKELGHMKRHDGQNAVEDERTQDDQNT
ncbi:hypothetical protein BG006_010547, partial [Podila minutissima]